MEANDSSRSYCDCGSASASFLSATTSSGAMPMTRKRTHSLEQGGDRADPDINAKKPRVSSEAPSSRTTRKKRKKKRTVPVVEDIAGPSSTRSHDGGTESMTFDIQRRGGRHGKPRRVADSDEEDSSIVSGPTSDSQMSPKVCRSRARTTY